MYGGMITECSTNSGGSAVHNDRGCTFNMYGGSITKNGDYDSRGASVYNVGKFNMYGGSITENKGFYGVYTANNSSVFGTVVISGNKYKENKEANVFLPADGVRIAVVNLRAGSRIGVTRYQNVGTITTGGDEYIGWKRRVYLHHARERCNGYGNICFGYSRARKRYADCATYHDQRPCSGRGCGILLCSEAAQLALNGTYGEMNFNDGLAEFTLKGSQSFVARDLPYNEKYPTVYEVTVTHPEGFVQTNNEGQAGFIPRIP